MSLLDCVEKTTGPAPAWSILWLHGLGADGHDFEPIVPELLRPGWPALRFVFPHAPVRPVTLNNGLPMRAWYDLKNLDLDQRADETGVRQSIAQVEALIARENERGVPSERIVLAGFSQGGAIALAAGVRREAPLAALVGLSTYLPMGSTTAAEATPQGLRTPVFMAHGSHDPVVPEGFGARSRDQLRSLGVAVDWHTYPMPHSVCAEEVRDLAGWLGQRFQAG
ncbi:alpha/beta hydrolase [Arenimonas caeni]|uniref:Carboxylesterase n=1 Tax=Arenimonas caeni TaxID=2058085 RepID=A0A2P6M8F1_9GAMM|nr:dienelactone hydrolase family protein [Arenimonas caeni]PRH82276.1 carboxylesterase [Arenimonas caeni]